MPTDTTDGPEIRGRHAATVRDIEIFCARTGDAFATDEELLAVHRRLRDLADAAEALGDSPAWERLAGLLRRAHRLLHRRLAAASGAVLADGCRRHRLNRLERDALVVLVENALGGRDVDDVREVAAALAPFGHDPLRVSRALRVDGRLARHELVEVVPRQPPMTDDVAVAPAFLVRLMGGRSPAAETVTSYQAWLDRGARVARVLQQISGQVIGLRRGYGDPGEVARLRARLEAGTRCLQGLLRGRTGWPATELFAGSRQRTWVLLALLAKELGSIEGDDDLLTGDGLAAALSRDPEEVRGHLALLAPDAPLRRSGLVRPAETVGEGVRVEDEGAVAAQRFELGDALLKRLRVPRREARRVVAARAPTLSLEDLVFHDDVREGLDLAIAQGRHGAVLVDRWGLGALVPYGRGTTLLFAGGPGLGKTAAAEGLAAALGRQILVADYARLNSCWWGETEKNIVAAFRAAARDDAVLFFDEADAMFYDREQATHGWEARDVDVLLQELERFSGVCILATNRPEACDRALARRLAIKLTFRPPDRGMRLALWRRFLGGGLPLAKGVRAEDLAGEALTGGEIKNAVLNAARHALLRGPQTRLRRADFCRAIALEVGARRGDPAAVGFDLA